LRRGGPDGGKRPTGKTVAVCFVEISCDIWDRAGDGAEKGSDPSMAGHSKWANIQHRKSAVDQKRAKRWTKILREVTVSARLGGGDPDANPRLRSAIQDARTDNVPNDTIDRAIKKGTGELEGASYEEVTYEGYGPGGVAVIIEVQTDNRNRTVADLRHIFSRHEGSLGETNSVAWMFERRGFFEVERGTMSEEEVMELALEVGVEDIDTEGENYELYSAYEDYAAVREELEGRDVKLVTKQLAMVPSNNVEVEGGAAQTAIRLLEALEDHDDVQHVWANLSVDEEALAAAE